MKKLILVATLLLTITMIAHARQICPDKPNKRAPKGCKYVCACDEWGCDCEWVLSCE